MATPSGIAPVSRWREEGSERADDIIAGEVPVALTYNKLSHVVMMATPLDLEDLAVGFSVTEGIVPSAELLLSVTAVPREEGIELAMTVPPDIHQVIRSKRQLRRQHPWPRLAGGSGRATEPVASGTRLVIRTSWRRAWPGLG